MNREARERGAHRRSLSCVVVAGSLALAACGNVVANPDAGVDENCVTRTWLPVALANASFDDGPGGWTTEPGASPLCEPSDYGISPDSGTWAACLGSYNDANHTLTQAINLPPGTIRVRLNAKRCLVTTEPPDAARDTLVIEIQDASTLTTIADLASWSNLDAGEFCAWEPFELNAPVTGNATLPTLLIRAELNSLEVTTFFLDTMTLEAFGCGS